MELLLDIFLGMLLIVGILFLGVIIYGFIVTPFKKRKAKKEIDKIKEEFEKYVDELGEAIAKDIGNLLEELDKQNKKKPTTKKKPTKKTTKRNVE